MYFDFDMAMNHEPEGADGARERERDGHEDRHQENHHVGQLLEHQ
jgi:hypothetical protein